MCIYFKFCSPEHNLTTLHLCVLVLTLSYHSHLLGKGQLIDFQEDTQNRVIYTWHIWLRQRYCTESQHTLKYSVHSSSMIFVNPKDKLHSYKAIWLSCTLVMEDTKFLSLSPHTTLISSIHKENFSDKSAILMPTWKAGNKATQAKTHLLP